MKKILMTAAAACVAFAGVASAATLTAGDGAYNGGFASWIEYEDDALRGTADDRDNPLNALGATNGNFFEIGFGSEVTLMFGTLFTSPGKLIEVTFSGLASWPESVDVYVGNYGGAFSLAGSFSNVDAQAPGAAFTFAGGPFDAVKLVDTSSSLKPGMTTGGWDIDSVRISAVPVPAGGLLLLTGLGAFGVYRRRKQAA